MNKKLFTQIKNEWRSNMWLAIELLLVSVVMWYIVDKLYCTIATYIEPHGFDINHCYHIELGILNEKSPDHIPYHSKEDEYRDVAELIHRLKHRPDVEAVSLSNNSHPYNGSNSVSPIQMVGGNFLSGGIIRRMVTPDFVRVFRYTGVNGESPEQLSQILEEGKFLLSENLCNYLGKEPNELIGKPFYLHEDSSHTRTLGAVINNVRYSDHEQADYSFSIVDKIPYEWMDHTQELCVRVIPEQDKDFIARIKADSESQYRIGNIFISGVYSFKDKRRIFQQFQTNETRNFISGMCFLLLNVFLGILGTFWFRTQQRRCEIALHKIHGASDQMVFSRLISEGWLILLLITPIALLINYHLARAELNSWYNQTTLEWNRLLLCSAIVFILIATMIAIGISIPARKAMMTPPAEALHDE